MTHFQTVVQSAFSPDFNAAKAFFKLLGKTEIYFRLIPESDAAIEKNAASEKIREEKCNSTGRKYEFWNGSITLDGSLSQHLNEMSKKNREGYAIHAVINDGGQQGKDINKIRAVFTDFDTPELPDPDYAIEPSIVVRTSPGKHHDYWFTDEVVVKQFKPLQLKLIDRYKTDSSVNDLPRVMRIPGFYHVKGDPQLVTMEVNSGDRYKMSDIEKLCSIPVSEAIVEPKAAIVPDTLPTEFTVPEALRDCYSQLIALEDGSVNTGLNKIAFIMGLTGTPYDACESVAKVALEKRGTTWTQRETRTFNSGYSKGLLSPKQKTAAKGSKAKADTLRRNFEGRLRTNALTGAIELDGSQMSAFNSIYLDAMDELEGEYSKVLTEDVLRRIAEENTFHPIRDMVLGFVAKHGNSGADKLDTLATTYMGCETEAENIQARKLFRRLVMRLFYPGCQCDIIAILIGGQGTLKSTLLALMAFSDLNSMYHYSYSVSASDKDTLIGSHKSWISVINEVNSLLKRKEKDLFKDLVTTRVDAWRSNYGRDEDMKGRPRGFILAATSNDPVPDDSTGSRRNEHYNIVKRCDIEKFMEDREAIIAAIYLEMVAYLEGKNPQALPSNDDWHWYSGENEKELQERNRTNIDSDAMTEDVLEVAERVSRLNEPSGRFTASQFATGMRLLDRGYDNFNASDPRMHRVASILVGNGYQRKESLKLRCGGKDLSGKGYVEIIESPLETTSDKPETVSIKPETVSTNEPDDTYYQNVPMDQIRVGDEVTDQITRQMLRVIEINGDTLKLGDINNGLPNSIRNRSDCVDARRLEKFTDF